jgi:hypothetical protein
VNKVEDGFDYFSHRRMGKMIPTRLLISDLSHCFSLEKLFFRSPKYRHVDGQKTALLKSLDFGAICENRAFAFA